MTIYTQEQADKLQSFITKTFGLCKEDMIAHEISSEYVHTDVHIVAPQEDGRTFVTSGMGARQSRSPLPDYGRTELILCTSAQLDPCGHQARVIAAELCRLSKLPFRENTWFGPGHTIDASSTFSDTFGFEFFLFLDSGHATRLPEIGKVGFLTAIPIYQSEWDWIVKNDSFAFIDLLYGEYGDDMFFADMYRKPLDLQSMC